MIYEVVRNEFLVDIGEATTDTKFLSAPYIYHVYCSKVSHPGRPTPLTDEFDRENCFYLFTNKIITEYPKQASYILKHADFDKSVMKSHRFITIGNIKVGTMKRDTPSFGKKKASRDSDIELKSTSIPEFTRHAVNGDISPKFASILEIVSIKPFTNHNWKHQTYYFLQIIKFDTKGHFRSNWYVDRLLNCEVKWIQPKEIHQVQVMMAKSGELNEKYDVVAARLGRAPILLPPLRP